MAREDTQFKKGQNAWNKGTKGIIKANKGSFKKGNRLWDNENNKKTRFKKGEKCRFWQGGISFEPYSVDWTDTLKRSIRERDHYLCQLCLKEGNHCHHIDYDKKNCNPSNLITLCVNCHSKTNHNRDYWMDYFQKVGGINQQQMEPIQ